MDNKKYLNEEEYQQAEAKLLKLSRRLLIVSICLSVGIILLGLIITILKKDNNEIQKVDYVADTKIQIEDLKIKLKEKQQEFTIESSDLTNKKSELLAKGIEPSTDYNDGEAYDLHILDEVLDPSYNSCSNNKYKKNELTKEYCILRNDVEELEEQIEYKEKYISSGRATDDTNMENERLERQAEWDRKNDKNSILPFIMLAIPMFMFPAMIALMMFTTAKRRHIMAFTTQQAMPIVKEGIEEVTPSIAKEISKGVRDGLNDEEK